MAIARPRASLLALSLTACGLLALAGPAGASPSPFRSVTPAPPPPPDLPRARVLSIDVGTGVILGDDEILVKIYGGRSWLEE